jgi:hypothetical protein
VAIESCSIFIGRPKQLSHPIAKRDDLRTGVLPHSDNPHHSAPESDCNRVGCGEGSVAYCLLVLVFEYQCVPVSDGRPAKKAEHLPFCHAEPERDRQLDSTFTFSQRPAIRICSCIFIQALESEAVNPAATHFAAFKPESPSSSGAGSLKTEPLKGIACVAAAFDISSKLQLHRRQSSFFEDNLHVADLWL